MTKHTPGPWVITEDDYGEEHWLGGVGEGQIIVNGWINGGCKKNPEAWATLQAEAHLIAAAPELLEALQALSDSVILAGHDNTGMPALTQAWQAIDKALGETK